MGNIEASTFNDSPLGFIFSAGLIVSKAMKQSTGTLVPHTLMDSSLRQQFTRTKRPFSVTWRQLHRMIVFKCGQLWAMAYNESSVINVPPIFRWCKELALDISWTTPLSVIPVMPHSDMDVKLLIHFAIDILYNPVSVIWQPQRRLEMSSSLRL